MRRDAYSEEEATGLISTIITGGTVDAPAMTMARLLRSMIKSDDGLYFIDWSSIEGRFAPWLANSPEADKKLDLYRNGNDVYVVTAAEMFNLDTGLTRRWLMAQKTINIERWPRVIGNLVK
jgi:hypothetical protein